MEGEHVFLGDWNLYHEWWAGIRPDRTTTQLAHQMYNTFRFDYEMVLLTERGARTWQRGGQSGSWSTLDSVFVSAGQSFHSFPYTYQTNMLPSGLALRASSRVAYDIPTGSDHFCSETDLEISPNRILFKPLDWNNADEQKLRNIVQRGLGDIMALPMLTATQLDDWLEALMDLFRRAEKEAVPELKLDPQQPTFLMSSGVRRAYAVFKQRAREWKTSPTPENTEALEEARLVADELWRIERENAYNQHILESTADLKGLYRKMRWAKCQEHVREPAHMPDLLEPPSAGESPPKRLTDPEAKCDCLAKKLLLVDTEAQEEATAPELPWEVNDKKEYTPCLIELSTDQIHQLLTDMPRVRATVDGGVSNVMLKLCQDILVPHFTTYCKTLPIATSLPS
jgi:hypothetical protein